MAGRGGVEAGWAGCVDGVKEDAGRAEECTAGW